MKERKRGTVFGIMTALLLAAFTVFPAYAHTAEGTDYQNVSGTRVYYTAGVPQDRIDQAVYEYGILPDTVKDKMNTYGLNIYLYPSSLEADEVNPGFVAVAHSGVWQWFGTERVTNLTPPWIDVHADRMTSGTLVHEAGHSMDHLYVPGRVASASRADEFLTLYSTYLNALAAVDASTLRNTYIPEEAYAECFRLYLTNREALDAVSPQFSAYIEKTALSGKGVPAAASSAGSASGGTPGPGTAAVTQDTYGWIRDARGWRYRFDDGRFPAE